MGRCVDTASFSSQAPQAWRIWSGVLEDRGTVLSTKFKGLGLKDIDWKDYAGAVDVLRSRGLTSGSDEAYREAAATDLPQAYAAWSLYEKVKGALSVWDFADLLQAYWERLTAGDPLPGLARLPRIVFVDEAQDNSLIQLKLAAKLAQEGRLVLVGDLAQSIFSWRGAFPAFFQDIDHHVENVRRYSLPINYRSRAGIVDTGNRIAGGTSWAHLEPAKSARTDAPNSPPAVVIRHDPTGTGMDGAAITAGEIADQVKAGVNPGDFAILCRTNIAVGQYEVACVAHGLPVAVSGKSFWRSPAVESMLAYCMLATGDYPNALEAVINKPKRYLKRAIVDEVRAQASLGIPAALRVVANSGGQTARAADAIRNLASLITRLRAAPWPKGIIEIAELLKADRKSKETLREGDEDTGRVYDAVIEVAHRFGSATDLLRYVDHCQRSVVDGVAGGRVILSTLHKSKGLEYKTVYLPLNAGELPHPRSEGDPARLEEERRLLYVGATRAIDRLIVTCAGEGSSFLPLIMEPK
jgi:DNA helicase-2/ATP-dependent DNA helicase PcrA